MIPITRYDKSDLVQDCVFENTLTVASKRKVDQADRPVYQANHAKLDSYVVEPVLAPSMQEIMEAPSDPPSDKERMALVGGERTPSAASPADAEAGGVGFCSLADIPACCRLSQVQQEMEQAGALPAPPGHAAAGMPGQYKPRRCRLSFDRRLSAEPGHYEDGGNDWSLPNRRSSSTSVQTVPERKSQGMGGTPKRMERSASSIVGWLMDAPWAGLHGAEAHRVRASSADPMATRV